jgi:NAD(P)-dependent dehydrogenase (short-subunit alcohol dehydrogenase family)
MGPQGRLAGKVALVTGGARGLGLAIARGFAREGASLALLDLDEEALAGPVAELRDSGAEALALKADVTAAEEVRAAFARAVAVYGRLDILVNNAGVQFVAPSEELALADLERVLGVNLLGVFLCAQAAGKVMLEQHCGSIINIASLASFLGMAGRLSYTTTKTAVVGATRALAAEWAGRGVRVNAIAPGYILTEMTQKSIDLGVLNAAGMVARTPMGRLGTPDDVVGPAIFLASDESSFVTGHVLVADGGVLAAGYVANKEG